MSSYLVRCMSFMVDLFIREFFVLYQMIVTGKGICLLMRVLPKMLVQLLLDFMEQVLLLGHDDSMRDFKFTKSPK